MHTRIGYLCWNIFKKNCYAHTLNFNKWKHYLYLEFSIDFQFNIVCNLLICFKIFKELTIQRYEDHKYAFANVVLILATIWRNRSCLRQAVSNKLIYTQHAHYNFIADQSRKIYEGSEVSYRQKYLEYHMWKVAQYTCLIMQIMHFSSLCQGIVSNTM